MMKKNLFYLWISIISATFASEALGSSLNANRYLQGSFGYTYSGDFEGPILGAAAGYRLDHQMSYSHNIELEALVFVEKGSNDFETNDLFAVITSSGNKEADFLYVKRRIHLNEVPILLNYRYEKNWLMQPLALTLSCGVGAGINVAHISEVVSGQVNYIFPGPNQTQVISSKDSSFKCKPMAQVFAGLNIQIADHTCMGLSGKLMLSDKVGIRGTTISTQPAITGPDVQTGYVRGLVAGTLTYLF